MYRNVRAASGWVSYRAAEEGPTNEPGSICFIFMISQIPYGPRSRQSYAGPPGKKFVGQRYLDVIVAMLKLNRVHKGRAREAVIKKVVVLSS